MNEQELLEKAAWLTEQSQKDKFVRQAIIVALNTRGLMSIGMLANEYPDTFEDLYQACKTMVEELPWV